MDRTRIGRLLAIGVVFTVLAVAVLLFGGLKSQVTGMLSALTHLRPATVGEVITFSCVAAILSGVEWWRLLHRLGYAVSFRTALTAYLSAGLGGYVMNSVGPAIGSAASLRQYGVSPGRATLLTLMANALGFCGILIWVPLGLVLLARTGVDRSLPVIGGQGPLATVLALTVMVVAMLFVLTALASASTSRNRLARLLLGQMPGGDGNALPLCSRHLIALVPWSAASWVVGVGSLYAVLSAMAPGTPVSLVTVVGAAALASGLGSLAFFVPEGVGVSESTVAVLLAHATGLSISTSLAAALAVRALDPLTKVGLLGVVSIGRLPVSVRSFAAVPVSSPGTTVRFVSVWLGVMSRVFTPLRQLAAGQVPLALSTARSLRYFSNATRHRLGIALVSLRRGWSIMKVRRVGLVALGTVLVSMTVSLPFSAHANANHAHCYSTSVSAKVCLDGSHRAELTSGTAAHR